MVNQQRTYLNIHTHTVPLPGERSIHSIYKDFEQAEKEGFYSIGLHPWYIGASTWKAAFEKLKAYSRRANVLAIGECGLDKISSAPFDLQQEVFVLQLQWAAVIKKPLIIHCVRAYDEVLRLLKQHPPSVPVVFHGFNKNLQLAEQVIRAGHYLSFGEALKHGPVQQVFRQLPVEKLFLETDDSSFSIGEMYHFAAAARSVSAETLSLQLQKNATEVFGITFQ